MTIQVYEQGGYGVTSILSPAIIQTRNPSSTDLVGPNGNPYQVGQLWENQTTYALFTYGGQGQWITIGGGTSEVDTLSGDTGTANPVGGNIKLAGTSAQIVTSASGSTVTFALAGPYGPATYTAHGVLIGEGASAIVATAAGTDGQVLTGNSAADPSFAAIGTKSGLTAHGIILGQGTGAFTALGVGATGTLLAGATGADPAFTGSPSVSGSLTAATTITATLGNITASNGNFVASTAGTGLVLNSPSASIVATNPAVVNGRSGQATFTTVSIAAAADLTLTITNSAITGSTTQVIYSLSGVTTGAALSIKSVTNSAGSSAIVVTNGTGASTSTADIVLTFLVLN